MNANVPILCCDGPVVVFGGAYSNLEATRALLDEAARLSIPSARVICTGDVVAYGADAAATAALVREAGCHVVMGNCEESLADNALDCGCGFPDDSACQRLSSAWFSHADHEISAELRSWMAGLPRRIDVEVGGARFAVVHGSSRIINRFIFSSTPAAEKASELDHAGVDGIIGGHSGLPFTQVIDGRLWHNAGAIGMPANDGTPRVWFSIIEADGEMISIQHRALDYDFGTAARKIRDAGLPEGYAAALETGIWPSCDVLPLREIRERGAAINEGTAVWRPLRDPLRTPSRRKPAALDHAWPRLDRDNTPRLDNAKFKDPVLTAKGERRASVSLKKLTTLWINTGTLCNITCKNCYIESSPRNDRLVYISRLEVAGFLDEIATDNLPTEEIGLTGGEPFMNPDIIGILEDCLTRGFKVLILTNAMRPMQRHKKALVDLKDRFGACLSVRVSLDHYSTERHEEERGPGTFAAAFAGLLWLGKNGFNVSVAGRTMWGEDTAAQRAGYERVLSEAGISVTGGQSQPLILFPEMEAARDVPEITTDCWDILNKSPDDVMCSSSRMVVKRKGAERPAVLACTLLPYDEAFELGATLKEADRAVPLNHPYCAQFCVLGGSSCSGK
ncbi:MULTISPECIES: radical SAM protein [unclassified Afipia]|uniref:radical SAM protein n=1 Tax=unclassified Afipia TaxID=2642050 RepID=UPI0003F8ABD8|nr:MULTISPECIES: radical SAM protein [unclassified Afipia]